MTKLDVSFKARQARHGARTAAGVPAAVADFAAEQERRLEQVETDLRRHAAGVQASVARLLDQLDQGFHAEEPLQSEGRDLDRLCRERETLVQQVVALGFTLDVAWEEPDAHELAGLPAVDFTTTTEA